MQFWLTKWSGNIQLQRYKYKEKYLTGFTFSQVLP